MSQTPAHDFLQARLVALLHDAEAHAIARDVAVAVLTDLITSPQFNRATPDPMADSAPLPAELPARDNEAVMAMEKNAMVEKVANPSGYI